MPLPPCHTASRGRNQNGTQDSGLPGTISGHLFVPGSDTHFTNVVRFDPHEDPAFPREGIYSSPEAPLAQDDTSDDE